MKAFVLEEPAPVEDRPLQMTRTERPTACPDEILVRVSACGVCRTDLHVCEGELAQRRPNVIPGHQVVGRVVETGRDVEVFSGGERVGVAWLNRTCGLCVYCRSKRENLCDSTDFTGWTVDGGFAEYIKAPSEFVYPIPDGFSDTQAAPLLCAGIIGYRALRLTGIAECDWSGARLGIFGFGAAGHVAIQIARFWGAEVYVATRDRERHQRLAGELGAKWVGETFEKIPDQLDASIVFAPAGEIVPVALASLSKGGTLVLGGIYMTPIPELEYQLLYGERTVRTVANNTREDGREFFVSAEKAGVKTHVVEFPFEETPEALISLKHDAIRGAAVIRI